MGSTGIGTGTQNNKPESKKSSLQMEYNWENMHQSANPRGRPGIKALESGILVREKHGCADMHVRIRDKRDMI